MSNMCKPVDPSRSFAEVLKTSYSRQEQLCLIMSNRSKIEVSTLPKVQVPRILKKWTPHNGR